MRKLILSLLVILLAIPTFANASEASSRGQSVSIPGGPTFWVHDVVRDESVTLKFSNFPAGKTFHVFLGKPGKSFGYGYDVGNATDSQGTDFIMTFKIPAILRGKANLGVMVKNLDTLANGYNIFTNTTGWNSSFPLSLSAVDQASSQSAGTSVEIFTGPTLWIGDVVKNKSVLIKVTDYDVKDSYHIYMTKNEVNARKHLVGQITDKSAYIFNFTLDIPITLFGEEEIKIIIENKFNQHSGSVAFLNTEEWKSINPVGYYTTTYVNTGGAAVSSSANPFTNILNVVSNSEVTLQTFNFPADKEFIVTMGPIGTKGVGGIVVGTQLTGETGGSFIATYPIPSQLRGSEMIAIRFTSTDSGHFSYDYFQNEDGFAATASSVAFVGDWNLPAGTYPNMTINTIIGNSTVTVSGYNFTKNDNYMVYMGAIGTQGVGGVYVGDKAIDASGTFTDTFNIPASLAGHSQIAIRMVSKNTVYYTYNWFFNSTNP
jgi:hypothetical protein